MRGAKYSGRKVKGTSAESIQLSQHAQCARKLSVALEATNERARPSLATNLANFVYRINYVIVT